MLDDRYRSLYRRYLKEALKLDKLGLNILKADCSNEYHGHPEGPYQLVIGGIAPLMEANVTCVEINEGKVQKCLSWYPEKDFPNITFIKGSICDLPFEKEFFDVILDFSTIDHLTDEEMVKALNEYERTLKPSGSIVIVVWTFNREKNIQTGGQNFASESWIRKELNSRFRINYEEVLITETNNDAGPNTANLILFKGEKWSGNT